MQLARGTGDRRWNTNLERDNERPLLFICSFGFLPQDRILPFKGIDSLAKSRLCLKLGSLEVILRIKRNNHSSGGLTDKTLAWHHHNHHLSQQQGWNSSTTSTSNSSTYNWTSNTTDHRHTISDVQRLAIISADAQKPRSTSSDSSGRNQNIWQCNDLEAHGFHFPVQPFSWSVNQWRWFINWIF